MQFQKRIVVIKQMLGSDLVIGLVGREFWNEGGLYSGNTEACKTYGDEGTCSGRIFFVHFPVERFKILSPSSF